MITSCYTPQLPHRPTPKPRSSYDSSHNYYLALHKSAQQTSVYQYGDSVAGKLQLLAPAPAAFSVAELGTRVPPASFGEPGAGCSCALVSHLARAN